MGLLDARFNFLAVQGWLPQGLFRLFIVLTFQLGTIRMEVTTVRFAQSGARQEPRNYDAWPAIDVAWRLLQRTQTERKVVFPKRKGALR